MPLIVVGRERVVPQQAGLVSDFTLVLGQNTTPGTADSTRRNSGSIIAETNNNLDVPNIPSIQQEIEGKQGN